MTPSLEQVLADAREEAAVLKRAGHPVQAAGLDRLCDAVARAAEDYLTWLTEPDARLQSGRSVEWLRGQFPRWMDQGLARLNGRKREYRALIVPRRANLSAAREAGRRAALDHLEGGAA
jgi:hypothetical protein